jgi:hypothetical protein
MPSRGVCWEERIGVVQPMRGWHLLGGQRIKRMRGMQRWDFLWDQWIECVRFMQSRGLLRPERTERMPRVSTRVHRKGTWASQVLVVQHGHLLRGQRIKCVQTVQLGCLLWEQRIKRVWFM